MSLKKKVASYIVELSRNSDAGNNSHKTLYLLYRSFGKASVDSELKAQFDAQKATSQT